VVADIRFPLFCFSNGDHRARCERINAFAWKSQPAGLKKSRRIAALQIGPGSPDELCAGDT
jgi:hypothetical protein